MSGLTEALVGALETELSNERGYIHMSVDDLRRKLPDILSAPIFREALTREVAEAIPEAIHTVRMCKWGDGNHALAHSDDEPYYTRLRDDLAAAIVARPLGDAS